MNTHWYMGIDLGANDDARNPADYFAEATPDAFEIGDIVNLIVGGPDMVIISMCECGTVEVAWVKVYGDVTVDVFPAEALVYA